MESGPDPLAVVGDRGLVRYSNPAFAAVLGRTPDELKGRRLVDFLGASEARRASATLSRVFEGGLSDAIDLRLRRRDGAMMTLSVASFSEHSGRVSAALRSRVVTRLPAERRSEGRWYELVEGRLARSLRRARFEPGYQFGVLVLGLDRFELISDTLDPSTRDALVSAVAERLTGSVRPGDQVADLGHGKFYLLADRMGSPDDVVRIVARIQRCLKEPFRVGGQEVAISMGIGVALSTATTGGPQDMLRDARIALHRAQAQGPGRFEFFDDTMRARAVARLRLESDLRLAVDRWEFTVHYQPIVDLRAGRIAAFEALVRWRHPARGLLAPMEFIPVAEDTGLIIPICSHVLSEACAQVRRWQLRFPQFPSLSVSMNFTSTHFAEIAVIDSVSKALELAGLEGASLIVELTESVLLRDPESVMAVLNDLKRMRVRVHLDDFGTGYSSLSYLSRLPVDALKIDRSFISRLGTDADVQLMVRAIVELAHNLGKEVVAEGIETEQQAGILKALNCDYGQGYYYARPADRETIESLSVRWQGGVLS